MLRVGTYPVSHPPSAFSPPSLLTLPSLRRLAISGYLARGWPVSNGREDSRVKRGWERGWEERMEKGCKAGVGHGEKRVEIREGKRRWQPSSPAISTTDGEPSLPPVCASSFLIPLSPCSFPYARRSLRSSLRCLSHRISLYSHDNGVDALQVQADAR